jgi:hypothetical protein
VGRTGLAAGLECAEGFAEPDGRAVRLAGAELGGVDRGEADRRPEAAVADGRLWVSGDVAGLNVATDSMAPATRQTARMLASNGITVPRPANGAVSFRSLLRRR